MPRKSTPVTIDAPALNEEAIREDMAAAAELGRRLAVVDEQYGDGEIYDRARLVSECRFYVQQTGQALLELGRRLVLLKEHEEHGSFIESLRAIGVAPRFAQRAMQAAVKFSKPNASAPTLLTLGQTKLIELLVLDDEEIETLSSGGTVADLTLDEIDRMSTRELRAALREEREERAQDQDVHERLLTDKNKKIDELDAALQRRDTANIDETYAHLQTELWGAAIEYLQVMTALRQIMAAIDLARGEHGPTPMSLYQTQCDVLVWMMQQVEEVRAENQITDVDLQRIVEPPWEKAAAEHQEHVSEVRREAAQKSVASRRAKKAGTTEHSADPE